MSLCMKFFHYSSLNKQQQKGFLFKRGSFNSWLSIQQTDKNGLWVVSFPKCYSLLK